MAGHYLRTKTATPHEIEGTYTVILYGARFADDIETVAVLDREGDPYTFVVRGPVQDYKVIKGMSAEDALVRATEFVSFHASFRNSRLSGILDYEGNTIGYEVRPLYSIIDFGYPDVLDVSYRLTDGIVTVWVSLSAEVRRMKYDDDRPLLFKRRWR
jgi:hypothetical protein